MELRTLVTALMSAQGVLLGLKLTGQIAWPWLSVFSPILIVNCGMGLFMLVLIVGLMDK